MTQAGNREMVLVALGSNLGAGDAVIARAVRRLGAFAAGPVRASTNWRTAPVDCPPGAPDFVNAAAVFDAKPGLPATALLAAMLDLEREFGERDRSTRNAPRVLDLDLILFGNLVCNSAVLTLPHPRALTRRFVLGPAAELAPDRIWPGTTATIAQCLADLTAAAPVTGV